MKKWKCNNCGYVFEGETVPEICAVCGADSAVFTETDKIFQASNRNWLCLFCGFIYEAETQPELCPECQAKGQNIFVEYDPDAEQMNEAGDMYRCNSCRQVTFADDTPEECPACGAASFVSRENWFRQTS